MQVRALLLDFRIFAPIEIDYQKAFETFARKSGQMGPGHSDSLKEVSMLIREAKTPFKEKGNELAFKLQGLLEELELAQIVAYSLNPGVKKGLASLKTMKLSVAALTELGPHAGRKFLLDNEIKRYIDELVARNDVDPEIKGFYWAIGICVIAQGILGLFLAGTFTPYGPYGMFGLSGSQSYGFEHVIRQIHGPLGALIFALFTNHIYLRIRPEWHVR
jgi:hypothetical protein